MGCSEATDVFGGWIRLSCQVTAVLPPRCGITCFSPDARDFSNCGPSRPTTAKVLVYCQEKLRLHIICALFFSPLDFFSMCVSFACMYACAPHACLVID